MMKSIVCSGIQPTGSMHLGNYLATLCQWRKLAQDQDNSCIFFIADLHAITVAYDPQLLKQWSYDTTAMYLACGIDFDKAVIFVQSAVAAHAQLAWIIGCLAPLGSLNRMTQFKDKTANNSQNIRLGLYSYPVLMAADILLYKAHKVPVGDDQKQHLELTRDIAQMFNNHYSCDFFPVPEPLIDVTAPRIMSLKDATTKMSKSDPVDFSRINLLDSDDTIAKKVKKAKTDSLLITEDIGNDEERKEAVNLLSILAALTDQSLHGVIHSYIGRNFSGVKKDLTEALIAVLSPIRQRTLAYRGDVPFLEQLLEAGAEKARAIAEANLQQIHQMTGLSQAR